MVRTGTGRSRRGSIYHKVRQDEDSGNGSLPKQNQRSMVDNSIEIFEDDLNDAPPKRLPPLMADSRTRNKRFPQIGIIQKYSRRIPSYNRMKRKRRGTKIDDKNQSQNQSLTTPIEGQDSKGEQYYFSSKKYTDPSHDTLEQVTDAEYGISHSYDPDKTSDVANSEGDVRNREHAVDEDEKKRRKRRKFIVGTSVIVLLLIGIITIIAIDTTNSPKIHPPTNLEIICSLEHISTTSGHKECSDACSAKKCCFSSGNDDCHKVSEDECNLYNYAFCANLYIKNDGDISDVSVVEQDLVDSVCTVDNIQKIEGREECEDACQPRSCCFTSIHQDNCMLDNSEWCNVFKACLILADVDDDLNDIVGDLEVQNIVVNDPYYLNSVDTDGKSGDIDVDDLLTSAGWEISEPDVPDVPDVLSCSEYDRMEPCEKGLNPNTNEFCYWNARFGKCFERHPECSSYGTLNLCERASSPNTGASCYWADLGSSEECRDDAPPCSEYNQMNACTSMSCNWYDLGVLEVCSEMTPDQHVDTICSDPSREEVCYALCSDYLCCFDAYYKTVTIACYSSEACATYRSCSKFSYLASLDQTSTYSSMEDISNESTSSVTNLKEGNVNEICSIDNLITADGVLKCKELCEEHMCCFGGDCERNDDCLNFQECSIMMNVDDPSPLPTDVPQEGYSGDLTATVSSENEDNGDNIPAQNNEDPNVDSTPGQKVFTDLGQNVATNLRPASEESTATNLSPSVEDSTGTSFESACQSKYVDTELGKNNCKAACEEWSCCWDPNDDQRCIAFECILAIRMCEIDIDPDSTEVDCSEWSCCENMDESTRCNSYECVKSIKFCRTNVIFMNP